MIVGQHETIDQLLVCALTGSHALLVGVPGLAKTLLVKALASAFDWKFNRIQFTPDLMPSDITGYELLGKRSSEEGHEMVFRRGPVFANLVLADEINRAAPKTQSALLEAMAERHVTVGGVTYALESPFLVVATQNPIEQEGTYPLPEAQLERFMMEIRVGYPSHQCIHWCSCHTANLSRNNFALVAPRAVRCLTVAVRCLDRGREVRLSRTPLPPNRTCGFPAYGSPVSSFLWTERTEHGLLAGYRDPSRRSIGLENG